MSGNTFKVEAHNASVATTAKRYVKCPICGGTLMSPIYQCHNGHLICNSCIKITKLCEECRVSLDGPKIRNVALENICKDVDVNCPYKEDGCQAVTTVETLRSHMLEACAYHPFHFCSNSLGWNDCTSSVSDITVLSHLQNDHPVKEVGSRTFEILVKNLPVPAKDVHFDPLLVTTLNMPPLLIRSVVSKDGNISFTCLALKHLTTAELQEYRIKYRIESKEKTSRLKWSGQVQPYRNFNNVTSINSFRVSIDSLAEFSQSVQFSDCGERSKVVRIKVAVWKSASEAPPSLEEDVEGEISLFPQKYEQDSFNPNSPTVFATVKCDVCELEPIRSIRYKCMQCPNFDLCSFCMDLGHHSHHLFVRIQDSQLNGLFDENLRTKKKVSFF